MTADVEYQVKLLRFTIYVLFSSCIIFHRANSGSFDIREFVKKASNEARQNIVDKWTSIVSDKDYIEMYFKAYDDYIFNVDFYFTWISLMIFVISYIFGDIESFIRNDYYAARSNYIICLSMLLVVLVQHFNADKLLARVKYNMIWLLHIQKGIK